MDRKTSITKNKDGSFYAEETFSISREDLLKYYPVETVEYVLKNWDKKREAPQEKDQDE